MTSLPWSVSLYRKGIVKRSEDTKMLEEAAPGELEHRLGQATSGDLESRIGLYWLNRIGVASLVIGLALLLTMSFLHFGPVLKLIIGFILSALLIAAGEVVIRKSEYQWYGQGLIGGGWSLAFFAAYAGHHLEAVRVIASPAVDVFLLLLIAGGSMLHAAKRRSQTIAVLSCLLGFITISLTPVGVFSALASALLNTGLCILAVSMRWHLLLVLGAISCYGTYFLSGSNPVVMGLTGVHPLQVACTFLIPYWIAYTTSLLFMDERDNAARRALVAVTALNALGFIPGMLTALDFSAPELRSLFLFGTGVIYALSLAASTRHYLPTVSSIHNLLAVSLVTIGISEKLSGQWLTPFWLGEIALLAALGLRFNIREFRWFALAISPLAFAYVVRDALFIPSHWVHVNSFDLDWNLISTAGAAAAFLAASVLHYRSEPGLSQSAKERQIAFYLYFTLGSIMLWFTPLVGINSPWQAPFWAMVACALYAVGIKIGNAYVRSSGFMSLIWGALSLAILAPHWHWIPSLVVASAVALIGHQYKVTTAVGTSFTLIAVFLTSILLMFKLEANWGSLFFTLEGFLLVITGFYLQHKYLRLLGLLSFAAMMIRLLLVDLGGITTMDKVFTFVMGGCVLLAASWIYALLSNKRDTRMPISSGNSDNQSILYSDDEVVVAAPQSVGELTT
jgi:hypothetical protein